MLKQSVQLKINLASNIHTDTHIPLNLTVFVEDITEKINAINNYIKQ